MYVNTVLKEFQDDEQIQTHFSDVLRSRISLSVLQDDPSLYTILRCRPSAIGPVSVSVPRIIVIFIFPNRIEQRFRSYSFG